MADGKVVIGTALDNSGIKKGAAGLKSALGGVAAAVGVAFSLKAVTAFGAEAMKASTELSNAMMGLQSIAQGQGRSFEDAQKFIDSYVEDGLIPATQAITAYKNLALRGYDDSQIKQVMVALKDSAAFGRQASYTLGQAVESATEGLKNENSILVDNAGVTKNVAKMWEEYAHSIGTTANNLTQQQKIQAEVAGIMEEGKYQVGDAAKVAETYSGQLLRLGFGFQNLKVAIGNAIIPIAQAVLPTINAIITALTRMANTFAQVMASIFGKSSAAVQQQEQLAASATGVAAGAQAGVKAEEKLAQAAKKAGNAAKGASMGLDELNVAQQEMAAEEPQAASPEGPTGAAGGTIGPLVPEDVEVPPGLQKLKNLLDDLNQTFSPSINAWGNAFIALKKPVEEAFAVMGNATNELWKNGLVPLSTFILTEFIPSVTNGFSECVAPIFAEVFSVASMQWALDFESACQGVTGAINSLVLPVAQTMKQAFSNVFQSISEKWEQYGGSLLSKWVEFKEGMREIWQNLYNTIIKPIFENIAKTFDWLWNEHLKVLWDNVIECVAAVMEMVLAIWNNCLQPLVQWMIDACGPSVSAVITLIIELFGSLFAAVSDVIGGVIRIISGLAQFITGVFTKDWKKAWEGIEDIFGGAWDSISGLLDGAVNGIIDVINGLLRAVFGAVNKIIAAINSVSFSIPDWEIFGDLAGTTFNMNLQPLVPYQIPKLARGAVLPANKPFLATVGDQTHGTNIEAPLDTIKQAMAEVLGQLGGVQHVVAEQPVELLLDGEVLYRTIAKIEAGRGAPIGGAFANAY